MIGATSTALWIVSWSTPRGLRCHLVPTAVECSNELLGERERYDRVRAPLQEQHGHLRTQVRVGDGVAGRLVLRIGELRPSVIAHPRATTPSSSSPSRPVRRLP